MITTLVVGCLPKQPVSEFLSPSPQVSLVNPKISRSRVCRLQPNLNH